MRFGHVGRELDGCLRDSPGFIASLDSQIEGSECQQAFRIARDLCFDHPGRLECLRPFSEQIKV